MGAALENQAPRCSTLVGRFLGSLLQPPAAAKILLVDQADDHPAWPRGANDRNVDGRCGGIRWHDVGLMINGQCANYQCEDKA